MTSGKKAICTAITLAALLGSVSVVCNLPVAAKASGGSAASAKDGHPLVEMQTSKGPITIELFQKEAPVTANNFLDLVNKHFYDGLTFHRYEPGFVIQGGDPNGNGSGNYIDPKTHQERHIRLEKVANLRHDKAGMVAMARTSDPDSASCQFYITLAAADFLDNPPGYAVFGKVVHGMDSVMKLRKGDKIIKATVAK